jgi:hypothetical protein
MWFDRITQVESTLFRVPRAVFAQSPVFNDMFSMPQGDNTTLDGSSDQQPLKLEGISAYDFRALVTHLLPLPHLPKLDANQLIAVLRLTKLYQLDEAWKTAVSALDALLPCSTHATFRLYVSYKCVIPEWRLPALMRLVTRPEPLNMSDARYIPLPLILKIGAVREEWGPYITDERRIDGEYRDALNDAYKTAFSTILDGLELAQKEASRSFRADLEATKSFLSLMFETTIPIAVKPLNDEYLESRVVLTPNILLEHFPDESI